MTTNGYSRMGASGDLRSMDLTAGQPNSSLRSHRLPWGQQQQKEEEEEIRFEVPVPLSRSRSSASQRFAGGASAAVQAAVKRAFSMRKSSSVREGYWRIHDSTGDDGDDAGEGCYGGSVEARDRGQPPEQQRQQGRRKKGKLIRACKRLFGY